MSNSNIILSVMVISHNQVHLIGRCLDSILRQRIRVPWEIVISDDASTDGTWEWIQEAAKLRKEEIGLRMKEIRGEVLDGEFIPEITCSQINSSDYNPTVTSDRCAANKANVYSLARGKYCVNIDADDYLLGDDIYQYQIDQLEAHPECSVAVQNIWNLKDGDPIEKGHTWWPKNHWGEHEMFTVREFCDKRLFISNPALMMRRDPNLVPINKYGLLFDDPIISMHHMVRGKIITSQRAQYVYVKYNNSIWNTVSQTDDEIIRMMTPLVVYAKFFPQVFDSMFWMEHFVWISRIKVYMQKKEKLLLNPLTVEYVERLHCKVLSDMMEKPHSVRAKLTMWLFLFMSKFEVQNTLAMRICYKIVKPN